MIINRKTLTRSAHALKHLYYQSFYIFHILSPRHYSIVLLYICAKLLINFVFTIFTISQLIFVLTITSNINFINFLQQKKDSIEVAVSKNNFFVYFFIIFFILILSSIFRDQSVHFPSIHFCSQSPHPLVPPPPHLLVSAML